ncbi:hypothetical protein HG535_0D05280 [Zygotorulaspora mrakii]|uniref:Extracellular mutant protein 11 C-terminal domain-containing protein n=1 Tax=Zygotorulaspora mrakii TaxID=42260 RepID=A0A7H9B4C1_ZYGMR|nr:uncharacterized protein HG535_0D05280 [Zygotorulaspora mrakii]QLG72819.1 hypothetical protein HG535_0D05280 [Zygotorulaspora mrakii]
MTLIKAEENPETRLKSSVSTDSTIFFGNSKAREPDSPKRICGAKDSRPALVNKSLNVASPKKDSTINLKKPKPEDSLLSAVNGLSSPARQRNLEMCIPSAPRIKSEFEATKMVLQETIGSPKGKLIKSSSNINFSRSSPVASGPGINSLPSSIKKKKLKSTTDKFKKISSTELFGNLDKGILPFTNYQHALDAPGEYFPITRFLYELHTSDEDSQKKNDLFADIEQDKERKFCQKTSQYSLSKWIEEGQNLMNRQTNLIGELVRERIELSHKFRVITTIINQRAEALNGRGDILDEKLNKIKSLGKEILNII